MTGLEFLLTQCLYSRDEHHLGWDKYVYDSEFIHNVILKLLMETNLRFAEKILQPRTQLASINVKHEPQHGLFDLLVKADNADLHYVEIKIWSALTEGQFNRQTAFLSKEGARGIYILFTNAADKWPDSMVIEKSGSRSHALNGEALLEALKVFETTKPPLKEIEEIATVYRAVLEHLNTKRRLMTA